MIFLRPTKTGSGTSYRNGFSQAIQWLAAIGSLYITASSIGKKQHTSPLADLAAVRVYISHVKFT
jgi:hypothetical protein